MNIPRNKGPELRGPLDLPDRAVEPAPLLALEAVRAELEEMVALRCDVGLTRTQERHYVALIEWERFLLSRVRHGGDPAGPGRVR